MKRAMLIGAVAGAVLLGGATAHAAAPVVVELFTSQGCSSCPPANANLIKLSDRPGVLTLSFAVTYWDYLGWKDTFDRPEYTARQEAYEPPLGQPGPFTPQMVINGARSVVGNNLAEVEAAIGSAPPAAGPAIALRPDGVNVAAGQGAGAGANVWLVRFDPRLVEVPVGRGENTGRTLPHTHVVKSLTRLGTWRGEAQSYPLSAAAGLNTAILVQAPGGGPILSAVSDFRP